MRIPVPLNALRAFEAAARHLSIKDAALELAVTPSAVSHQLRILEDMLGVELLRRIGTRLELTDAGRRLAPDLNQGFALIAEGVGALREERRDGPLRVNMLPAFATNWLAPRLNLYPFKRRGFSIQISTTQDNVDLAAGVADVGIWYGKGQPWSGMQADFLFEVTIDLYSRPGYVTGSHRERIKQISKANLFVSRHCPAWRRWMEGLPDGPLKPAVITQVDSSGLTIQAAADGAGVSIAVCELAENTVREGRLESVFNHPVDAGIGFWLVYPEALREDRRLDNFRGWLRDQISKQLAQKGSTITKIPLGIQGEELVSPSMVESPSSEAGEACASQSP
ncbi:LysR family transcriptional regulator [Pseudomonas aeruginosa]|uniref:LysR substrate-binding domain-containing protein n=1 Tax=Pseudomonas aeruginosa TaxID=287 RepID=UPI000B04A071|nr:LysR substrate-binding domain-containing protein [Pseudomonas aeruginosa]PBZ53626.1 LysR family transcriptional regulator [Pseudomonas aeruginosa]PBZ59369.1 LysR family transcriptional regulator [Pseudomonas aeruginosa]PBZ65632.1 LysR family transcriptional regulator [Pseudomonas aeruginosa]